MSRFQSSIATLRALEKAASVSTDEALKKAEQSDPGGPLWTVAGITAGVLGSLSDMFALAAADLEQQQAAENGKVGQ